MRVRATRLSATGANGSALRPINIPALFAAQPGRTGAWYGSSWDEILAYNAAMVAAGTPANCVAYEDAVGAVPLLAPLGAGKGCGLLLDREFSLARGPELATTYTVVNSSGTSLTLPAALNSAAAGTCGIRTPAFVIAQRKYRVRLSWTGNTGGLPVKIAAGGDYSLAASTATAGSLSAILGGASATEYAWAYFTATAPAQGFVVTEFSVRELPGNHLSQPTAAARGELSRRVNLLTATEDFSDAVWGKTAGLNNWNGTGLAPVITPNFGTAPDGTATADRIQLNRGVGTTSNDRSGTSIILATPATPHVATLYVKPLDATTDAQLLDSAVGVFAAGIPTAQQDVTDVGDGWKKITRVYNTPTAGPGNSFRVQLIGSVSSPQTMDLLVWGADLRLSADAIPSIPAYQRVTSASDYDEAGFPAYLRRQTDDWMRATAVNPAGATKALVMTAVQKMTDTVSGMAVETGPDSGINNGVFRLAVPASSGANSIGFVSRGTLSASADLPSSVYLSPSRLVVRAVSDIAGDSAQLHVNGVLGSSSTADQGTGAYLQNDIFVGSRAGTSLFVNLREYSPPLILFMQPDDPGVSDADIARIEREMNKSIKAY
jgi:hypothetical protein